MTILLPARASMTGALLICAASTLPAHALDGRIVRQLNALAPEERVEQRCDLEAMDRLRKEGDFRPDKVIAYTFSDPVGNDNGLKATGAAFRSGGDWFKLRFKCGTDAGGLSVTAFDYKVGSKIPREEWDKYYLYD